MNKVRRRFIGSLDQLQYCVGLTGAAGEWEPMPAGFWRFRCRNGAILNWWQSTGTFNFQGPTDAARRLEQALAAAVGAIAPHRHPLPHNISSLAMQPFPTASKPRDHLTSNPARNLIDGDTNAKT